MFVGELIRDDTDRVGDGDVIQHFVFVLESPSITKNISPIGVLGDDFLRDSRTNIHSFAVADYAEELSHDSDGQAWYLYDHWSSALFSK